MHFLSSYHDAIPNTMNARAPITETIMNQNLSVSSDIKYQDSQSFGIYFLSPKALAIGQGKESKKR